MEFLLVLPAIVSLLLLCAHWFRAAGIFAGVPLLCLVPLLLVPRGFVARLFQTVLALATLEWARAATMLALERAARGEPWIRMAVILGAVALFSLASALLFETETLRRTYPRRPLL